MSTKTRAVQKTVAQKTVAQTTVAQKTAARKTVQDAAQVTARGRAPSADRATSRTTATPWGRATVVERVSVPQRAGDKHFESLVELLACAGGEQLVRISYSTGGAARRGPVTLRLRDLARLRRAVGPRTPALAEALGWEEGA
jgi:hypothetical protein